MTDPIQPSAPEPGDPAGISDLPRESAAGTAQAIAPIAAEDAPAVAAESVLPVTPQVAAVGVPGQRLGVPEGAAEHVADYGRADPSYLFLFVVSVVSLALDILTKTWAEKNLSGYPGTAEIWRNHLTLVLAKNRGGAWGLLQTTSESVRRPFFLLVSAAAIIFIMTLYRRLQPRQTALRWGLPFVLGGALGNVFDRIRYGQVIDFIDAHTRWGGQDHHWPTFNIADVCICIGVGLMAVDMFSNKRGGGPIRAPRVPPAQSGEPVPEWYPAPEDPAKVPPKAGAAEVPAGGDDSAGEAAPGPSPQEAQDTHR